MGDSLMDSNNHWQGSGLYPPLKNAFFTFFLNPKTRLFTFFEAAFQKNAKRNPKFEVSDCANFALHGISTTVQKQCNVYVCGLSSCEKDNKSD